MIYQSFKTFQEAFLGINKTIIENPTYVTDSRLGFMNEIPSLSYTVEDISSYEFPNPEIGRLDYQYANLFYDWMVGGCTDNTTILEQYPNTARFMEKPKSEDLPANFNTFYGPRILEQLPFIEKELKESPTTRRAVISILEKTDLQLLDKDELLEFPCCDSVTFFIRDEKLNVHLHMRSQNMGQILKLDMYIWARFTIELAEKINRKAGYFTSSVVSAHVFKRDINYLSELINQ
jgi:hypothetical protein